MGANCSKFYYFFFLSIFSRIIYCTMYDVWIFHQLSRVILIMKQYLYHTNTTICPRLECHLHNQFEKFNKNGHLKGSKYFQLLVFFLLVNIYRIGLQYCTLYDVWIFHQLSRVILIMKYYSYRTNTTICPKLECHLHNQFEKFNKNGNLKGRKLF